MSLHTAPSLGDTVDFGLFDVHGNVFEGCVDTLEAGASSDRELDPVNDHPTDVNRIARGGSFKMGPVRARSSHRSYTTTSYASSGQGLRPVRAYRTSPTESGTGSD